MLPVLLLGCALFDTSATDQRILELTDGDQDGYSLADPDCDDADPEVHPDAPEVCDGKDNDCDRAVDEDGGPDTWCRDEDGDGHGDPATLSSACDPPTTAVLVCDDCDDRARAISPDGVERCNGLDDDCDGVTDPTTAADVSLWYEDADGDGYGDAARTTTACDAPTGYTDVADDCDDTEPTVHPGAVEACNDGLDNDCDGTPNGCGLAGTHLVQQGEGEEGYYSPPEGEPTIHFGESVALLDTRGDGLARPMVVAGNYPEEANYGNGGLIFYDSPPNGASDWDDSDRIYYGPPQAELGILSPPLVMDLDGDAIPDTLIGAWGRSRPLSLNGSVLLMPGLPERPTQATLSDVLFEGFEDEEYFGKSLESATGMYGGTPTLLVSAPTHSGIQYHAGAVYLLDPSETGAEASVASVYASAERTVLGWALSPPTDLDGDGIDDLLLSSACSEATACAGWIMEGPLHGTYTVDDADLTFRDLSDERVGFTLTAIQDLRGDGAPSLVLTSNRGAEAEWYVLPPTLTGEHTPDSVATARLTLPQAGSGGTVSSGDLNGDGAPDLLANHLSSIDTSQGAQGGGIYLLYSPLGITGTAALPDIADASWLGIDLDANVGSSVATGDANNDGFDDLFFSGKNPEDAEYNEQSAWFFYGQGI